MRLWQEIVVWLVVAIPTWFVVRAIFAGGNPRRDDEIYPDPDKRRDEETRTRYRSF
jgi:hypothetical protein